MHVSLLTGGGDRPYAVGLATVLIKKGLSLDIIAAMDWIVLTGTTLRGCDFLTLGVTKRLMLILPQKYLEY